jgi:hypothetical protein
MVLFLCISFSVVGKTGTRGFLVVEDAVNRRGQKQVLLGLRSVMGIVAASKEEMRQMHSKDVDAIDYRGNN